MKRLIFFFLGTFLCSVLFTLSIRAQAPASIVGGCVRLDITGGVYPFASSGYALFLTASSGNGYKTIGISDDIAGSSGTYVYTRKTGTTATVSLSDAVTGPLSVNLTLTASNYGNFYVTASAAPGAYQSGHFQIFLGKVPASFLNKKLLCSVSNGSYPFPSTGTFTLATAASARSYTITGDGVSVPNSSGTYSYSGLNTSTAKMVVNDTRFGSGTFYIAYAGPTAGSYIIDSGPGGGVQVGSFVVLDTTPPTLTINSPTSGQRWSNTVFTVTGSAKDNIKVAQVYYRLNEGAWAQATTQNAWTNWTGTVSLVPGTNVVQAYALDSSNNVSTNSSKSLVFVVTALASVQTTGSGTVSPNYNAQKLELGRAYTMTATAGTGFAFTNWTGTLTSTAPALTFIMVSNLTLTANFVDVAPPVLTIASPGSGQVLSTSAVTVRGTATDNAKVATVYYQLNTDSWKSCSTTNAPGNWSAVVLLVAGTNTFRAFAVDAAGNVSVTKTVNFVSPNAFDLKLSVSSVPPISPNGLGLMLNTATGLTCRIEFSTNLLDWIMFTNLQTAAPATHFRDPAVTNDSQRFYRAVLSPP